MWGLSPLGNLYLNFCGKIIALQHNMFHVTQNLKEKTMFDFEKQYKDALEKFETLTKQTRESYEFWYSCLMDTWKDLYSKKK
jgi:hypothetical protein